MKKLGATMMDPENGQRPKHSKPKTIKSQNVSFSEGQSSKLTSPDVMASPEKKMLSTVPKHQSSEKKSLKALPQDPNPNKQEYSTALKKAKESLPTPPASTEGKKSQSPNDNNMIVLPITERRKGGPPPYATVLPGTEQKKSESPNAMALPSTQRRKSESPNAIVPPSTERRKSEPPNVKLLPGKERRKSEPPNATVLPATAQRKSESPDAIVLPGKERRKSEPPKALVFPNDERKKKDAALEGRRDSKEIEPKGKRRESQYLEKDIMDRWLQTVQEENKKRQNVHDPKLEKPHK